MAAAVKARWRGVRRGLLVSAPFGLAAAACFWRRDRSAGDGGLIEESDPPEGSLAASAFPAVHYADWYRARLEDDDVGEVATLAWMCLTSSPGWILALMRLRDRFVRAARLDWKTIGDVDRLAPDAFDDSTFRPGSAFAIFHVYDRSPDEIVLGIDDRHLDFRMSLLLLEERGVRWFYMGTVVRFHGRLGRIYFNALPVKMIHRLIVPALLRNFVAVRSRTRAVARTVAAEPREER